MSMENWQKHLEKDKKIGEEVEIEKMIKGLEELLLWKITIGVEKGDVQRQGDSLKRGVDYFIGHPDRVAWLKNYLEESKTKMKVAVPGGDLSILGDKERWKNFPDLVFKTAREIRDGYLGKDFEEKEKRKAA